MRPERLIVPAASARALDVPAGWAVRVTDPQGSQVGDLFCVSKADTAERFSQSRTRTYHQRVDLRPGDWLW